MKNVSRGTTWVEINLDNLEHNYKGLREKVSKSAKMCMVIKANGYGHGSVTLAKFYEKLGADFFAVARSNEGFELRNNGIHLPILNLGYTTPDDYEESVLKEISMTIFSYDVAKKLNEVAKNLNKKARVHIKLDTGMSRLGFVVLEDNIDDIIGEIKKIDSLENVEIEGIFTHFATSDTKNKEFRDIQTTRFNTVVEKLKEEGVKIGIVHCSNSAEILDSLKYYDMVRPGIVQYGIYPSDEVEKTVDVKPVMSFKTKITNIKTLKPGSSISYGRTYFTTVEERIASIAIGYADGFFRGRKNPHVNINGVDCKVVGRVCMDQCMVRIPMDLDVKIDDEVLIFGEEYISATDVANESDTIEHEILCAVGRREKRFYIKNGEVVEVEDYL